MLQLAQRVSKALAAAVTAAAASYGTAVQTDGTIAGDEWITLAVAALGAFLVVYFAPKNAELA